MVLMFVRVTCQHMKETAQLVHFKICIYHRNLSFIRPQKKTCAHDEDSGAGVNEFYSTERPLLCLYSKHNTSTHRSTITPVRSPTVLQTQTQTLHLLLLKTGNCLRCSLSLWIFAPVNHCLLIKIMKQKAEKIEILFLACTTRSNFF